MGRGQNDYNKACRSPPPQVKNLGRWHTLAAVDLERDQQSPSSLAIMWHADRDTHSSEIAAGVGRLVGDGIDAPGSVPRPLGAQEEGIDIHDHDVIGRVAISKAVIRLV